MMLTLSVGSVAFGRPVHHNSGTSEHGSTGASWCKVVGFHLLELEQLREPTPKEFVCPVTPDAVPFFSAYSTHAYQPAASPEGWDKWRNVENARGPTMKQQHTTKQNPSQMNTTQACVPEVSNVGLGACIHFPAAWVGMGVCWNPVSTYVDSSTILCNNCLANSTSYWYFFLTLGVKIGVKENSIRLQTNILNILLEIFYFACILSLCEKVLHCTIYSWFKLVFYTVYVQSLSRGQSVVHPGIHEGSVSRAVHLPDISNCCWPSRVN